MYHKPYIKTKITFQSIIIFMIITLMVIGTLNSTLNALNRVGLLALVISLGIANIFLLRHFVVSKRIYKSHLTIIIISLIFILINLLGLFNNFNDRSIITLAQFISLIGFFIFASLIKWTEFRMKIARNTAIVFVLINFIYWVSTGFQTPFKSFYPNPNLIGIFTLLMLFFILMLKKKSSIFYALLSFTLIYASEARAALLGLTFALLIYFIWPIISKTKLRHMSFIIMTISGLLSVIFIYPKLIFWSKFHVINDFVRQFTGKNIYSGRQVIWSNLIDKINEKPLLGYGTGVLPRDIIDSGLSAHNFYLQVTSQNGYLGLFAMLILFISIWVAFRKNRNNRIVRLSASFFIAILVYISFEVSLTQNQIASGIIMWFIFSVGLSFSTLNYQSDEAT